MLTTAERTEMKRVIKYMEDHPLLEVFGEGDSIADQLEADDQEMFRCSESIARGEACLSCDAVWEWDEGPQAPDTAPMRKLDHKPNCVYSNRLMEEDL